MEDNKENANKNTEKKVTSKPKKTKATKSVSDNKDVQENKVKVSEIMQAIQNKAKNKKTTTLLGELIEFRNYVSIEEKAVIADNVSDDSLKYNDNGMVMCNYVQKNISVNLYVLLHYTNIDLDDENKEFILDYNFLSEHGIFEYIFDNIADSEIAILMNLIELEINQMINLENSVSNVLSKKLTDFVEVVNNNTSPEKMKDLVGNLSNEIKNFDWNSVSMLSDIYNKVNSDDVPDTSDADTNKTDNKTDSEQKESDVKDSKNDGKTNNKKLVN